MTSKEATAEILWTAFKTLSKKEQEAVLARLLQDENFVEDSIDIALIEEARHEPGQDVPLREYIEETGCRPMSSRYSVLLRMNPQRQWKS